jgi:hypothetical protein
MTDFNSTTDAFPRLFNSPSPLLCSDPKTTFVDAALRGKLGSVNDRTLLGRIWLAPETVCSPDYDPYRAGSAGPDPSPASHVTATRVRLARVRGTDGHSRYQTTDVPLSA